MIDLIRRSEVINLIESKFVDGCLMQGEKTLIDGYGLIDEVSELPTDFDTEKVVEQLEEVNMNYFLTIANTGSEKLDIAYGYASDSINKAIDIVKKGGVE